MCCAPRPSASTSRWELTKKSGPRRTIQDKSGAVLFALQQRGKARCRCFGLPRFRCVHMAFAAQVDSVGKGSLRSGQFSRCIHSFKSVQPMLMCARPRPLRRRQQHDYRRACYAVLSNRSMLYLSGGGEGAAMCLEVDKLRALLLIGHSLLQLRQISQLTRLQTLSRHTCKSLKMSAKQQHSKLNTWPQKANVWPKPLKTCRQVPCVP